jgi:uncharacterized membrane protein YeaQ/YmgE (transglycosylase-associated protein family)
MNWILALIIGGFVGWLASIIAKTNAQMGCFANVLVGVGGSLLGFWIAGLLGISATGGVLRFAVALAGAVLLILILRQLGLFKRKD